MGAAARVDDEPTPWRTRPSAPTASLPTVLIRTRVQTSLPVTRRQMAMVAMLSERWTYKQIAAFFGLSVAGVREHIVSAAARIPGDGPPAERCVMWYRGASLQVLFGRDVINVEDLDPALRRLAQQDGTVLSMPALAPSAAPAPDYRAPNPREQRSRKTPPAPPIASTAVPQSTTVG